MPGTLLLVVSDDPSIREQMTYGAPSGIEVLTSSDAREAWRAMSDLTPRAVVVDLQTGSAGGFALVKDMSSDPRLEGVPVMILLEREQDSWLARRAGAAAFRVKPVPTDQLMADCLALLPA